MPDGQFVVDDHAPGPEPVPDNGPNAYDALTIRGLILMKTRNV